jgi:NADH:ubiquinone oxidoreductase subunit B-like Fe-S oxidoreductase
MSDNKNLRRRKYDDLTATVGEDGWTKWIWPIHDGYRFRCCDCELVHVMQFKIDGDDIGFRARRDRRATAASRRGWWGKAP